MTEYAPYMPRPSTLALTVACPASVKLQAGVTPLPETDEEAEGTAAHFIAMKYAEGYAVEFPVGSKFKSGGRDWTVDLDMVTGAIMYREALGGPHPYLRLEDGVAIPRIHERLTGTPDAWRFFLDAREAFAGRPWYPSQFPTDDYHAGRIKLLRIGDYKFGHRYVEVFGNYQLSGYASGVMHRLELTDNDPYLWLELILVQPRNYHPDGPVRRWVIHASELRAYLNHAASATREALSENPRAITNNACIDCKARHACQTLQYATNAFVDFSGSAELVEMPHDAIGQELAIIDDAIDRLKARYTGLAAQADTLLRAGKQIAFYHMAPGESRLVYRDNVNIDEVVGLGELLGIQLRKPESLKNALVTPTQAIQLGIDEGVMSKYAHRPPAALKLTRDDSITARKVFAK